MLVEAAAVQPDLCQHLAVAVNVPGVGQQRLCARRLVLRPSRPEKVNQQALVDFHATRARGSLAYASAPSGEQARRNAQDAASSSGGGAVCVVHAASDNRVTEVAGCFG
jgi:hypothetical protein